MDDLVKRLVKNKSNPILLEPRISEINEIKQRIQNGFVFIKFTNTTGGTELGINVDHELTNITEADFNNLTGKLCIVGTCELNFHKLRCTAELALENRQGIGSLELLNY